MLPDAVVTVVPNGKLSALLSAIHGAGMGYLTRVATLERGDLLPQLQRAGIPISQAPSLADVEQVLFVNAGGRSISTATLLLKHGATRVWIVNSFGAWTVVDDVIVADSRIAAEPTKAARPHIPGRDAIPASPTESHPSSDSSPE
jgi:rhodanese-related sulfurtransferase